MEVISKNKELVDGLGYDESINRFYTNRYAYILVDEEFINVTDRILIKSGITRYNVDIAIKEAILTRGSFFETRALWGSNSDKEYLPEGISLEEANSIVPYMDMVFKNLMEESNMVRRKEKSKKRIGTEVYVGPTETLLETIKASWGIALESAIDLITGNKYDTSKSEKKKVSHLGSQKVTTSNISKYLKIYNSLRVNISGGYGKGFLSWIGAHEWETYKEKKDLIYYAHNIPATKQLAIVHHKYEKPTIYGGSFRRIVICSETSKISGSEICPSEHGILMYSASDESLKTIIKQNFKFKERVAYYVNVNSSRKFSEVYETARAESGVEEIPSGIADEIQNFTGDKESERTDPIVNRIVDQMVGFTATERRRGNNKSKDKIFNDDVKYFGILPEDLIKTPLDTIEEGRTCQMKFELYEISDRHDLYVAMNSNKKIKVRFSRTNVTQQKLRGNLLRALVLFQKAIMDNKTHLLSVVPTNQECDDLIRALNILKSEGKIPKEYEIISAKRLEGKAAVNRFNDNEKSICIGTPWIITGIDAPRIDAVILSYQFGSVISAVQFISRGQRVYLDKKLTVYLWRNPEDPNFEIIQEVIGNYRVGLNSHARSKADQKEDDSLGSGRNKKIDLDIIEDEKSGSKYKLYWEKLDKAIYLGKKYELGKHNLLVSRNLEKRILSIFNNGKMLSTGQIGELVGCSSTTVKNILRKNRLTPWWETKRGNMRLTVLELYHNGEKFSMKKIQDKSGLNFVTIKKILLEEGLDSWENVKGKERKQLILHFHKKGYTTREISIKTGLVYSGVHDIQKREGLIPVQEQKKNSKYLEVQSKKNEAIRLHTSTDLSNGKIAEKLGLHTKQVCDWFKEENIKSNVHRQYSKKTDDQEIQEKIIAEYKKLKLIGETATYNKVSINTGVPIGSAKNIMKILGLVSDGEMYAYFKKNTKEDMLVKKLEAIKLNSSTDLSNSKIAEKLGLSEKLVCDWFRKEKIISNTKKNIKKIGDKEAQEKITSEYRRLKSIGETATYKKVSRNTGVDSNRTRRIMLKDGLVSDGMIYSNKYKSNIETI